MLGHLQFDAGIDMTLNGDIGVDRCWRIYSRLCTASEFKKYLDDITREIEVDPEIAPDVDLGL